MDCVGVMASIEKFRLKTKGKSKRSGANHAESPTIRGTPPRHALGLFDSLKARNVTKIGGQLIEQKSLRFLCATNQVEPITTVRQQYKGGWMLLHWAHSTLSWSDLTWSLYQSDSNGIGTWSYHTGAGDVDKGIIKYLWPHFIGSRVCGGYICSRS